jgi:hypothetical protein
VNTYDCSIKQSGTWSKGKPKNLRVEGGSEMQTKGRGNLFNKTIAENFPTLCNDIDTHVQEAFWTPNRRDQKRTTPHHIIIKIPKLENKERVLKASREKHQLTQKGKHIRITSDLSTQTLKARKAYSNAIQALKKKN